MSLSQPARRTLAQLRAPLTSPRGVTAAVFAFVLLAGLVVARDVPTLGTGGSIPKPLALVLGLAGAVIFLTIDAEQLLLGWLVLAPILQESAQRVRVGHLLSLALYTGPPVAFAFKVLAGRRRWERRWFDAVPIFFVLYVFGSLVITSPSTLRSGAVGTIRAFLQTVALGPLLYYLVMYWRSRGPSFVAIVRVLLMTTIVQGAMTTVEWGTRWNLWHDTTWQEPGDVRAIGTLANPALTGAFIGTGVAVAVTILAWRGPAELRRLAGLAIIVGTPGLLATKTRAPILATAIACALCMLLSSRARVLGLGVMALVALTITLFWPQIRSSSVYQNRIDEKQNVEIRLVLQKISVKLAEERPITGWGYNSFDRVKFDVPVSSPGVPLADALKFTSHNTYLTILVEYGAIGLLIFAIPWIFVLVGGYRAARVDVPERWLYLSAAAGVLVIGLTATTLDYRFFSFVPAVPWLLLGMIRRQSERVEPPGAAPAAATAA